MFATQSKSLKALVPVGARLALTSTRVGVKELQHQQLQHAAGISTWDRVRSSMWHPMATMEQSLMDVERMTSQLFSGGIFPSAHNVLPRMRTEDDDFFNDLGVNSPKEAPKAGDSKAKEHGHQPQHKQAENQASSFSSYSFSSSTVLDEQGHRVSTIRRRYEDSTGRLKALHEREIDDKKVKKIWKRASPEDKGEYRTVAHGASVDEFEEQWKNTPFGQAEKEHEHQHVSGGDKQKQVGDEGGGEHQSSDFKSENPEHEKKAKEMAAMQDHPTSAFGMDYGAADAAPAKKHGKEGHGVTDESKKTSREEAIAQGSKTQEEETTPPHYTSHHCAFCIEEDGSQEAEEDKMFATQSKSLKALVPVGARLALTSTRVGVKELQHQQLQHAAGISTWDRVRSSMWHPMATMEQSLMDVERMTSQLFSGGIFPSAHNVLPRMRTEDDDFFNDLGVNSPKEAPKAGDSKAKEHGHQPQHKQAENQASSFSSYSFSSSTVLDEQGHRVSTIRRRYEDSTGRLKALHEREIDDKKVKKIWKRASPEDKGEYRTVAHGASVDEFEEQWKNTPFGQAEKEHEHQHVSGGDKQKQVGDEGGGEHQSSDFKSENPEHEKKAKEMAAMQDHPTSAFGMDYGAADAAPAKKHGKEGHGVTDESKKTSREEAIAQGSKTQEEETTPPHYTSQANGWGGKST